MAVDRTGTFLVMGTDVRGLYHSLDGRQTWAKMDKCLRVTCCNPGARHELYGINWKCPVRSLDAGKTWTPLGTVNTSWLTDVAYDPARDRVYATTDIRRLFQMDAKTGTSEDITDRLPKDNNGAHAASTVACDPQHPNVVYIGNHADIYATDVAVARSTDAGQTWATLTRQPGQSGPDGAREASCVRVSPVSRFLWVTGQCYGNWKLAPLAAPSRPAFPSRPAAKSAPAHKHSA